jgi:molybdopterin-guanine dinucleotide biosynthesis protein A
LTTSSPPAAGVVLAGGLSRRMGQPKALLAIAGEPLLRRVTRLLLLAVPEVVVVGPPELSQLVPDLTVLQDLHPKIGPLGGIETGLLSVTTELIFVVACDMPFINPYLIRSMLEYAQNHPEADVVALSMRETAGEGRMEHLHAVYRRSCLPAVTGAVAGGSYALHALFGHLRVNTFPEALTRQLDPSGRSALNANSPADWERVLTLHYGHDESQLGSSKDGT